jgi:hypothetical protein
VTRCLIVANRTMGGRKLAEHLLHVQAERGPVAFHLVVPEHGVETLDLAWAAGGLGVAFGFGSVMDEARAESVQRLQRVIATLRELGLEVTGEIGPAPPFAAITKALHDDHYDEIVISTLPGTFSRWLRMDLPRRCGRKFGLPVTTIVHDGDDPELVEGRGSSASPAEERAVRNAARSHPLCAALAAIPWCAVEVTDSRDDAAERLRSTGDAPPPELVVAAIDAGADTTLLVQAGPDIGRGDRSLLVVADRDDAALRHAADAARAWAFVPLTGDGRVDGEVIELMLVELAALGHRHEAPAP